MNSRVLIETGGRSLCFFSRFKSHINISFRLTKRAILKNMYRMILVVLCTFSFLSAQAQKRSSSPHSPLSPDQRMDIAVQIAMILKGTNQLDSDEQQEWSPEWQEQITDIIWLLEHPLSPSLFTQSRLEKIPLLDASEINLILKHSKVNRYRNWEEFLRMDGFTPEYPELIRHFFVFDAQEKRTSYPSEYLIRVKWSLSERHESLTHRNDKKYVKDALTVQNQFRMSVNNWKFFSLWSPSDRSVNKSLQFIRGTWYLSWSSSKSYFILGDFRTKSGSGILLSSSSGNLITGSGSVLTTFYSRPANSRRSASTLRGITAGIQIGTSLKADGFILPQATNSAFIRSASQHPPLFGLRILYEKRGIHSQIALMHHLINGSGISMAVSDISPFNRHLSENIKKMNVSGEWNFLQSGRNTPWNQAFQLQNEWVFTDAVRLYFGLRKLSSGHTWNSGGLDLQLTEFEKERHFWSTVSWTLSPTNGLYRTIFKITGLQMSSATTSPLNPLKIGKESILFSAELRNLPRYKFSFISRWNGKEDVTVFRRAAASERGILVNPVERLTGVYNLDDWIFLHAVSWQNTLNVEMNHSEFIRNRIRIQHTHHRIDSGYEPSEYGMLLGHDMQLKRDLITLSFKWYVFRTTTTTASRVADEYLYSSFSTFYAGGTGNIQSLQFAYESAIDYLFPGRVTFWIQFSRQERLNQASDSSTLTPVPVRYSLTFQTRLNL